jgi:hypothetical protein
LQCLDRPRFFAGQLLTEQELNGQQAYVLAKNRLHNRYLHGTGIVCGLEVTCNECDSEFVTVHPGYALDPCGNDIVVCEKHDFNVSKAIQACRRLETRDCDPWRTAQQLDCSKGEQEWCIYIRYREQQAQPVTALVKSSQSCGCGKMRGSCSCNSGTRTQAQTCEPTRIIEGYELGVVCLPDTKSKPSNDKGNQFLEQIVEFLDRLGIHLPFECLLQCVEQFQTFMVQGQAVASLLQAENAFTNRFEIERQLCRLLEDVRNHLLDYRLTQCDLMRQLGLIICPSAPQSDDTFAQFQAQVTQALLAIFEIVLNAFINCVCYELLPKCPTDPCEDRLLLACVTVRDGRVISICHHPRRYVLTAHTFIPTVLAVALRNICCQAFSFGDKGNLAVNENIGATLGRSMNMPFASEFGVLARAFSAEFNPSTKDDQAPMDSGGLVGLPLKEVSKLLGKRTIVSERVDWSAREAFTRNLETPQLHANEPVKLFVDSNDRVIGVTPYSRSDQLDTQLANANARIAKLERQLAKLIKGDNNG